MDGALSGKALGSVLLNGDPFEPQSASLSVFDIGLQRGYGCFEALRSYEGKLFRPRAHYDRLVRSAAALDLSVPPYGDLEGWMADRAAVGDCVVRVLVTGGVDPASPGRGSQVIVFAEPLPPAGSRFRVLPVDAPWHPDGSASELTGAKTLSYGPNLAASLRAAREGYDDALLIGRSGAVLEGPTYGVGWVMAGTVETPGLGLGILASITREALLEVARNLGIEVLEGRFDLDRVLGAEEVFALSTLKEVLPVDAIGETSWKPGAITRKLASGFRELVAAESGER